jgi:hypothetical protein
MLGLKSASVGGMVKLIVMFASKVSILISGGAGASRHIPAARFHGVEFGCRQARKRGPP